MQKLFALLTIGTLTVAGCAPEVPPEADPESASPKLGFSVDNMDPTTSPKEDFYRYAAGGWLDRTEILPTEQAVNGFTLLGRAIDEQLLTLIHEVAAEPGATGVRQQVGDFYASAMDVERLDSLGLDPLEPELARIAEAVTPAARAELAARHVLRLGSSAFIAAAVSPDYKQSDVNALFIQSGAFSLNRNEYLDDEAQGLRDLYVDNVATILALAGDSRDVAEERARTVLAIETELAEGQLTPLEASDINAIYNKMTLAELQALIPSLDIGVFLRELGVEPPETVIVQQPRALTTLDEVLTRRSADEIGSFLRWHVLRTSTDFLSAPYREASREFTRKRRGLSESPARERDVINQIRFLFAHPLSQLYVEKYFPETTRTAVEEMAGRIKDAFRERLETNPWLTEATRAEALEKLSTLQVDVGYPEEWIDFSQVQISRDDYLGNVQRAFEFSNRRNLAKLGQPVVPDHFAVPSRTTPVDVNAAYQPQYNAIELTAAVVQPPFFNPDLDMAVNYCTLGAVIGHEFTHAYDKRGRLFDATGNLRNWWTPEDVAEFERRTGMLVDQFNGYEVAPGLVQDGAMTVGENTADLGGITLAYHALEKAMEEEGRPEDIDGLTPGQRCFIGWGQLWMSKARPEKIREEAATNPHALSPFRVAGPLVNMAEFFEAFDIQPSDPMWRAPEVRAVVW